MKYRPQMTDDEDENTRRALQPDPTERDEIGRSYPEMVAALRAENERLLRGMELVEGQRDKAAAEIERLRAVLQKIATFEDVADERSQLAVAVHFAKVGLAPPVQEKP